MENRNMIGGGEGPGFFGGFVVWALLLLTPAVSCGLAFSRYYKVNPWAGMDEKYSDERKAIIRRQSGGTVSSVDMVVCPGDENPVGRRLKESKKKHIGDTSLAGIVITFIFAVVFVFLLLGVDNGFIKACVIIFGIISYSLGIYLAHYMNTSARNPINEGDWCEVKRLHEADDKYGWNGTDYSGNSKKIPPHWVGFPDTRACHDIRQNEYNPHNQDGRSKCCSCEDLRKYGNCLLANIDKGIRDPCRTATEQTNRPTTTAQQEVSPTTTTQQEVAPTTTAQQEVAPTTTEVPKTVAPKKKK